MYHLYENLDPYTRSPSILFEPVARLPYLLHAPAIVTHIPLFNKSAEDDNFERHVRDLRAFADEKIASHWRFDTAMAVEIRAQFISRANLAKAAGFDLAYFDARAATIWGTCKDGIRSIVANFPELFLFESLSLIDKELNKYVHGESIRAIRNPANTGAGLPLTTDTINASLFHLVNSVLDPFCKQIPAFLTSFQKRQTLSHSSKNAASQPPEQSQDILGGIVSWFEQNGHATARPSIDANSYLRIFWRDEHKPAPGNGPQRYVWDKYLIWRRGDQGWRYTFCDGIFDYAKPEAKGDVLEFIDKLFGSADLRHSFPDMGVLQKNLAHPAAESYKFPGTRLGGAQYFMIPVEFLVLCATRFDDLATLSSSTARAFEGVTAAKGVSLATCIDDLCRLPCFKDGTIEQRLRKALATPVTSYPQLIGALGEIKACFEIAQSDPVASRHRERVDSELHVAVARLAECLWKWIYYDASDER